MQLPMLPQQDNHCDCGLFLLTYLDYFTYNPPKQLNCNALAALKGMFAVAGTSPEC